MTYYNLEISEIYKKLQTSENGVTSEEVANRQKKYGLNELKKKKSISPFFIFLNQFNNFIVFILIGAVIISLFLKEYIDSCVIIIILILNSILGFLQEFKAEKAIEALKKLSGLKCTVIRNGTKESILSSTLVPGDIITFEAGDKIPADARLIEASRLESMESMLTGESLPVSKTTKPIESANSLGDIKNMVFSGTNITSGSGKAVVVSTAMKTEIGKIASSLEAVEDDLTPLQKKLDILGKKIGFLTIFICLLVIIIGFFKGGDIFEMIMVGVSLAVAAVPEGLPIVVTIALAIGVKKMAALNSLVKNLHSVETLGCTTVICTDKTGTLTQNEMTVKKLFIDDKIIEVNGLGYRPEGEFVQKDGNIDLKEINKLLTIGVLNNDAALTPAFEIIGDPTEGALIVSGEKAGLKKHDLDKEFPRIFEIPFDSSRKRKVTFHQTDDNTVMYVKGAPDVILNLCDKYETHGETSQINQQMRDKISNVIKEFSSQALRVLAFAYKNIDKTSTVEEENDSGLTFVGLQAMIDPPREEVKEAIKTVHKAGIRTIMITGDYAITAKAIAKELGMDGEALSGYEIDNLTENEFFEKIKSVSVFARVNPSHKIKIVKGLRESGEIVAMTGDGVNDAPAIKEADIGIAMGITGTEVSKEAADMILMDDKYTSIMHAVEHGRGIYENIKKFINYLLSSNLGEVLILFVAMLVTYKDPVTGAIAMPLLATQILWLNLVTDGLPAIALGLDPVRGNVMLMAPRNPKEKIITFDMIINISVISLLMCGAVLYLFGNSLNQGTDIARTIAFTSIVLLEMVRVTMIRSQYGMSFFSNPLLILAILISLLLQLGVVYIPFMNKIFKTVPLTINHWLLMIMVITITFIAGILVNKIEKLIFKKG